MNPAKILKIWSKAFINNSYEANMTIKKKKNQIFISNPNY